MSSAGGTQPQPSSTSTDSHTYMHQLWLSVDALLGRNHVRLPEIFIDSI